MAHKLRYIIHLRHPESHNADTGSASINPVPSSIIQRLFVTSIIYCKNSFQLRSLGSGMLQHQLSVYIIRMNNLQNQYIQLESLELMLLLIVASSRGVELSTPLKWVVALKAAKEVLMEQLRFISNDSGYSR